MLDVHRFKPFNQSLGRAARDGSLLDRADRALDQSKPHDRNRVAHRDQIAEMADVFGYSVS
jgi:hypothetical protein